MPWYFFDSENGDLRCDTEGIELPTERSAEFEAVRLLGELLAEKPDAFSTSKALTVRVTDSRGAEVFVVKASVVKPRHEM